MPLRAAAEADTVLLNLQGIKIDSSGRGRRFQFHVFQRIDHLLRNNQIAVPLVVGWHDMPRCEIGAGGAEHGFERFHIVFPEFAFFDIASAELPVFFRIVDALLQPFFLLILGNVQEKLQNARAAFG